MKRTQRIFSLLRTSHSIKMAELKSPNRLVPEVKLFYKMFKEKRLSLQTTNWSTFLTKR